MRRDYFGSHKALIDSHVYHVGVLFPSLYTGTVVNSFLLLAKIPPVQLAYQAREARNQGKYKILSIASCLSYFVHSFSFFAVPLLCPATNDNSPSTFQQMPPKCASWSEDDTKLLLDLCLQEKEKFNFNQQGLTMTGWNNIYTNLPHYDKKQCNNKLGSLKKAYLTWKDELTATGLWRDPRTGNIDADPEYWETQAGSQPMTSICYLVNISGYIGYIV